MAVETYKVLAQSNPSAAALTNIYTVPAGKVAVISSIIVANRGARNTFRLAVSPTGAADAFEHYLAYNTALQGNGVQEFTIGITLQAGAIIRVYATAAQFSFNVFGAEVTL